MGTGWRRAFCTSILRDSDTTTTPTAAASSQSSCVKLGSIFSSSNPSTPRLRPADPTDPSASTPTAIDGGPKLQCKTTIPHPTSTTPATTATATPNCSSSKPSPRNSSSPRSSPSRLALLKTALRLSRNRCGICGESVSQRTVGAVFTAECSHAFHFPCISTHVRSQGSLVCPVCSAAWREVPLLSSSLSGHRPHHHHHQSDKSGNRELKRTPVTVKIYDDDESLQLSPTCGQVTGGGGGMLFNPIPEEELDEDDGECSIRGRGLPTTAAAVSFVPENLALVSTGRNHLSYVLSIKMKASQQPQLASVPSGLLDHPSCRAPIDLVTVLDVSLSMTVAKLQMLKRAMRLVISSLGPGDRLSIVAFSVAAAKRLLPLQRMSRAGQRSARQIVDRLVICGSNHAQEGGGGEGDDNCSNATSCVGDALRKATKILEDRRERNPVATIMLLSDGHRQGNGHEHPQNQQPSSGTRFAHIEIPINSSSGGFRNRVQKQGMPIAEEEENSFARSVNGLVSVVLQDVCLQLTFPSTGGGVVSSVYSYNECDEDVGIGQAISHGEGGKNVCVGDLYAGEERRLLVELKVPKTFVLGAAKHALSMSLACTYRDPITRDVIRSGDQPIILPMAPHNNSFPILLRSSSSSPSSVSSPRVTSQQQQQELRNLFVTTRALAESRRLVELNDLETALHLVSSARALLLQQSKSSLVSASHRRLVLGLDGQLEELQRYQKQQRRRQQQQQQRSHSLSPRIRSCEQALLAEVRGGGVEPLTPTSAWRAAEQLAKVAIMRKSLNRVSDLHGFENARF